MKKLLLNSLILISLILFGFTSFAYNYTVYGYITDGDENPMSQVEVNIFEMNSYQDPTSTNYVTVYSDTDGYYEGLVSVQNTSDTLSTLLITVYAYCNGITETQTIEIVVQEEGQQQVDFEICSSNSGNDCFLGFYYYPSNFNFLEINFMSYSFMENSNDSVSIVNYEWDFGDGTTSTETNPVHIYNEEGTYNVVLTASSEECGELTYADLVYVSSDNVENCYADFYYYFDFEDSTSSDIPTNYNIINFVDASWAITDITSWTWEFGDGITSTEQNPTHEYTEDGEYLVSLTIETNDCSSTTEYYVWIGDPVDECYLGFYYYPSNFNYSEINFISYSFMDNYNDSIYIVNYEWDFGDGTTSTETNPVHIYNEEGTYIVVLTASSEECGELTYADLVYVSSDNVENCYADFYYYFDFEDSTSSDIPTNYNIINFVDASWAITDITSWTWEFGDGITSTEQNPTHEYTEDGEYLVSLTIETDDCSSTTEYYVWIGDNTWYPEECMAIFWAEYNQEDYFTVQFNDLSWGAGNEILSWDWNFGDGTESTEQNPSHTYTEEGEYLVSLTIHSDSCTSTFIEVVYIEDWGNSNGDFCGAFFIPEFIENSLSVQFYDLSIPIPESWTWNFGDGSTNTEQNPLHEYADSGIYIVTLTTQNIGNDSCIGTFEMEIYVHQNNGGIVKSFATGPSGITGIPNTTNKISPNISLYPNPVNDKLFIEIPNGIENAQVEIMNIAGQIILSQNFTNNKFYINTTELIQGLYIASIIIDGKRTNLKFIK